MLEKVRSYIWEVRADKIYQAQRDRYFGKRSEIINEEIKGLFEATEIFERKMEKN